MAEETKLEQTAKTAPPQDKKAEKPVSVWRSALEETVDAASSAVNAGIAVGLPLVADRGIGSFSGMGGFGATSTSGAFYLGADDRSMKSARQHSIIGTVFAAFAKYTLAPIYALGAYASAPLIPLWQLAANAVYMGTDNIVKKKSLYIENFKKRFIDISKKAIKYLSIPTYLTQFLPGVLQIPSIALQSYIFKKYIARDKKSRTETKEKTTYRAAFRSLGEKISKAFYLPLTGAEYLGRGAKNLYQSLSKKSTPAPAAQSATQTA